MAPTLGEFEQIVLLAVLRLGEDAYTVSIIEEIERRTGRRLSHAAVYVALTRMEKKGLVHSRLGPPSPVRGGRAKRFFRIDPRAMPLLRESRDALLNMWKGLESTTR